MQSPCSDCVVRSRALCSVLTGDTLQRFASSGRRQSLERGQTIAWQGDEDAPCATIISGAMKLALVDEEGEERITGLAFPSDFVGSPFEGAADMQVTALTDCEICIFPRPVFAAALEENRAMETELLRRTIGALSRERLGQAKGAGTDARAKVAALILELKARGGGGCEPADRQGRFDLPLSRAEMGQVLGLRIETISRELTRLEDSGSIERHGRRGLTVRDETALRAAAGA